MALYTANATDAKNFTLTRDEREVGKLSYVKWYSFNAEIRMADQRTFTLEPTGFWNAKIELKDGTNTLLEFGMGWKGIVIKTFFNEREQSLLLTLKGLLSSQFVLLTPEKEELLVAEASFKWAKLNFDYNIETSHSFERLQDKEVLILTILHCINYYMTTVSATG